MSNALFDWVVERVERFPNALFWETELRQKSADGFDELKAHGLLHFVQPNFDEDLYPCPEPGPECTERVLIRQIGKLLAVCPCPAEEPPIELSESDVRCYRVAMQEVAALVQAANGLTGRPAWLTDRLYFLGESSDVAGEFVVLGLLGSVDHMTYLRSLPSLLPKGCRSVIVGCPTLTPDVTESKELESLQVWVVKLDSLHGFRIERPGAEQATVAQSVFKRDGDTWHLQFEGTDVHVSGLKGLAYIALLLRTPNEAWDVLKMVRVVEGVASQPGNGRRASQEGLTTGGPKPEPVIDAQALADLRERVKQLRGEESEAENAGDAEAAVKARDEREKIEDYLSDSLGLAGHPRTMTTDAQRARTAVAKVIATALKRVDSVHPGLARHLRESINTGASCSYTPLSPVPWVL